LSAREKNQTRWVRMRNGRATEVVARPFVRFDWGGWMRTTDLLVNRQSARNGITSLTASVRLPPRR